MTKFPRKEFVGKSTSKGTGDLGPDARFALQLPRRPWAAPLSLNFLICKTEVF